MLSKVFARRALAAGAVVDSEIVPDVHAEIDPEATAIVVSNLLENAVKYGGKPAAVTIELNFDGKHAVLEVRDNGTGIPRRIGPSSSDGFSGVGMR